ncbi:MAG: 30S ribosomal protein S20 [Candidatus Blackburnbacteria bacterium]|nr:30S ribosomal protein S20 [Candidatus Blackburnbacteria bacterium]
MPILKSAKKALRHDRRNRAQNNKRIQAYREAVKAFRTKPAKGLLEKAFSALDRAVDNKVIHTNKASRLKSRLSKMLTAS